MGPFAVTEGHNVSYGVVLDTRPNATVLVGLEVKAPEKYPCSSRHPRFLVFEDEWNVTKWVVLSTPNDDIDNDDVERFRVVHYVLTADKIFAAKATNTVIHILDDDQVSIVLDSTDVLEVDEGGKL